MYEVGQILYTVLEDKYKVIPVKVVEQVVTKTLNGESIKYTVKLPNKKGTKISISKLNKLYTDIKELECSLVNNAKSGIQSMLKESLSLEKKYFEKSINNEVSKEIINNISLEDDKKNTVQIDLGNGQIGNVDISSLDNAVKEQKKT
tara:strand:+ start:783 stop:1223 length:441 start_codon:yes stop_codon:yes gene_type:complete